MLREDGETLRYNGGYNRCTRRVYAASTEVPQLKSLKKKEKEGLKRIGDVCG